MNMLDLILIIILGVGLYFLPTLIAFNRRADNAALIMILNLVTGWTLIGWIVAFVWAAIDKPQSGLPPELFPPYVTRDALRRLALISKRKQANKPNGENNGNASA